MSKRARREAALAGVRVLVTRPGGGASLVSLIEQHGGETVAFPVIDIRPPADDRALQAALGRLAEVDLAVFVSVHAVDSVAGQLARRRLRIPSSTRVAAVGPKTAARCARAAIAVDFVPDARIDSEGLLHALRDFQAAGKRVLIFRGQSGRETLAEGLRARGATVRHIESYRRRITERPVAPLIERWRAGRIDAVVISSAAVLDALTELLGARHRGLLNATAVFAYSARVADYCRARGIRADIVAAAQPGDRAVVEAIIAWRAARGVGARPGDQ